MDNRRAKALNNKNPFYYQDIINYIKNYNEDIKKTKAETKAIYRKNNPGMFKRTHSSWRNLMEKTTILNRLSTNMEKFF